MTSSCPNVQYNEKQKYHTVETVPKSNGKILQRYNSISLTNICNWSLQNKHKFNINKSLLLWNSSKLGYSSVSTRSAHAFYNVGNHDAQPICQWCKIRLTYKFTKLSGKTDILDTAVKWTDGPRRIYIDYESPEISFEFQDSKFEIQ